MVSVFGLLNNNNEKKTTVPSAQELSQCIKLNRGVTSKGNWLLHIAL